MSAELQNLLDMLCDGRFHPIEELQKATGLKKKQTKAVVEFLSEYGFAELNAEKDKIRISQSARQLLEKTANHKNSL